MAYNRTEWRATQIICTFPVVVWWFRLQTAISDLLTYLQISVISHHLLKTIHFSRATKTIYCGQDSWNWSASWNGGSVRGPHAWKPVMNIGGLDASVPQWGRHITQMSSGSLETATTNTSSCRKTSGIMRPHNPRIKPGFHPYASRVVEPRHSHPPKY